MKLGLFALILMLAALLRLPLLDSFPAGLNADEAAIGYNAYSLLLTGKDEYGTLWPLSFKSFGDYKPGLYFYLVLPFVKFIGLNEWSVRLPSALLGVGTVFLVFLIGKNIFNNNAGLLSGLLLAISPWHIHFSRGGWETNVATFFITLGVWLFLLSLKDFKMFFWSMLSFLVSMYTYQSPRLIIPILLVIISLFYFNYTKRNIRYFLSTGKLYIIILVAFTLPLLLQFKDSTGIARFSGLSFLGDQGPILRVNELRGEHGDTSSILTTIFHNKVTSYIPTFLGHYLDHFRPDFLFIDGDPLIRNKVPEVGQFYLIQSIFLIAGFFFLAISKLENTKFIFIWLLIAPLASSMTYQTPHALRALNMVIPLTLMMGFGFYKLMKLLSKKWLLLSSIIITLILSFEVIHYLESYYVHYAKRYPVAWEYGFRQMVSKLEPLEESYSKVVITDTYDQPYILVLFYKQYPPEKFQPLAILSPRDKFNFGTIREFDKYEFRNISPGEINSSLNTLFIGTEKEIPKGVKILDTVYFPNGEVAFVFATNKNI